MYDSWQDSVVLITSRADNNGVYGTGFVVHQDKQGAYVLTCTHVVDGVGGEEWVKVNDIPAKVIASSPADSIDIAVLLVAGLGDKPLLRPYVNIKADGEFELAGYYHLNNNPKQTLVRKRLRGIFSDSIQTGMTWKTLVPVWEIEITSNDELRQGNSGSPVVDENNYVIGIVNTRLPANKKRGWVIPIEALEKTWSEIPRNLFVQRTDDIPIENTNSFPPFSAGTLPTYLESEVETLQSKRRRLYKMRDNIGRMRGKAVEEGGNVESAFIDKIELEEKRVSRLDQDIRTELCTVFSPLPRQSYTRFIGRMKKRNEALAVLEKQSTSPIIAIDGIGGAGKTALARELAELTLASNTFYAAVWESDKPEVFTGGGILSQPSNEMSFENLLDRIGRKLGYFDVSSLRTMREKKDLVRQILKENRYLIVIDNLETIKGYRDLVNNLDGIFDNSKAILTTRKKVDEFHDVYSVPLGGMDLTDSIEFLRSEAAERGEAGRAILEANESLLERIYLTTGGLPLAMRLVLGQTARSAPNAVLKHLEVVNYQKVQKPDSDEDVYNQFFKFIYWDSWNQLSGIGKQLLIDLGTFDPIEGARYDFLSAMSELSSSDLEDAASELVEFSLVGRSFESDQEIFYLHPLTRYFVQNDV